MELGLWQGDTPENDYVFLLSHELKFEAPEAKRKRQEEVNKRSRSMIRKVTLMSRTVTAINLVQPTHNNRVTSPALIEASSLRGNALARGANRACMHAHMQCAQTSTGMRKLQQKAFESTHHCSTPLQHTTATEGL